MKKQPSSRVNNTLLSHTEQELFDCNPSTNHCAAGLSLAGCCVAKRTIKGLAGGAA